MMCGDEMKYEYKLDKLQCYTCLSIGRNLIPLGKHVDMFKKIAPETGFWMGCNLELVQICWECSGVLIKMVEFRNQVLKATELLEIGQAYLYGTLSNLTTVIFNDTSPNTIYITQTNEGTHTDIKPETMGIEINTGNISHFIDNDPIDNTDLITEIDISEQNSKPVIKKCKWAQKRALFNKKPKFKIIDNEDMFRKVKISLEELSLCLKKERDSKSYKSCTFRCETCVLEFKNDNSLSIHIREHHSQATGPYICDICHTRTSTKSLLSAHIWSHYFAYECCLCAYSCRYSEQCSAHARKHKIAFQCMSCPLKFGSRREFFRHHKQRHEKFICDHCGVSFKMRYCIEDHMKRKHLPLKCKLCDQTFPRYKGLWLHTKIRHTESSASQTAYCVECDRLYPDVYRYRWHLSCSPRHRPREKSRHPCPGCGKVFTKNIYMKDHYDLVHLKNYKYRCEECDKNFLRNADLGQHRKRVHEGILPPKNKICNMCGRGFSTKKILVNHVRTHTGERPFVCARCPAAFAQRYALKQHTRTRHAGVHLNTPDLT